ncbi:hypothetical protein Q3A66_10935 [Hymenobacter sp. BT770]|uniref:hypothetical protein n=1 Tax=Hymenobacter sp. BT770 TaxID=2886942 RepID=UPI001D11CC5D|nr:hypothetical protein [Hymenobacter sp. BT770]MCC3154891.1 hypothetical protein [Hymenobacter sp. BT770]MDO3415584.1 hypothetical protein [Hymenobacter sp. BT770]
MSLGFWRVVGLAALALAGLLNPTAGTASPTSRQWVPVGACLPAQSLAIEAFVSDDYLSGSSQSVQPDGPQPSCSQPEQTRDQDGLNLQAEQRRRLSRSYAVPKAGRAFSLNTRYGRVQINPWNKKEIKVEAELVARSETEAGARQVLDALGVEWLDYDARTGGVAVSTKFGPVLRGRAGGCRYEVNYTVWLPRTTALHVFNSFGEVTVTGDLTGPTELAVEYGALRTGRLEGQQNFVHIGNGDCSIAYAGRASIDASYARLRLDEGKTVDLRNNHSDVDMGTVQDLTVHSKYGDVALGTVRNLRGSSGYSRFTIDRLDQGIDMALRYCPDFVVRDMGANFRQVNLDGGFSTIRLGFAEAPSFRFDVSTEQGQMLVDKNMVRVLSQENGPQTSDVLGVYGGAAPGRNAGNVNIKVRYGTVRFSK